MSPGPAVSVALKTIGAALAATPANPITNSLQKSKFRAPILSIRGEHGNVSGLYNAAMPGG
jgi:hypothetical protein